MLFHFEDHLHPLLGKSVVLIRDYFHHSQVRP
jgi:hypothetical protein